MATITQDFVECPRCHFHEAMVFTTTRYNDKTDEYPAYEKLDCPICGYSYEDDNEGERESFTPKTFVSHRTIGHTTVHTLADEMPSDPEKAKKWIDDLDFEGTWGYQFISAVIVRDDGSLTWIYGNPEDFHKEAEEITDDLLEMVS